MKNKKRRSNKKLTGGRGLSLTVLPCSPAKNTGETMTETEIAVRKEVTQERERAEALLSNTATLKITNQTTLDTALEQIKIVKGSWKVLDDERKKATKPLDDAKKIIMEWFRPVLDALKNRETELKAASVKYLESRKTDVKLEGAAIVERWHAEITDKKLMPLEWLEPKMTELNKLATAIKGKSPIPGVEFVKETGMSSGSK